MQPSSCDTFLETFTHGAPESEDLPELTLDADADFEVAHSQLRRNTRVFGTPLAAAARLTLAFLAIASAAWLLVPNENTRAILKFTTQGQFGDLGTPPTEFTTPDPATRLLLHGDADAPDETSRWRALWESAPDNPVYFSRYANARLSEEKTVAPDLLADARRIDPENGFWPLVAACVDADDIVETTKLPRENGQRRKSVRHATDEEAVLRRLAVIHEAAAMPRFQSHQLEYLREAIRKMPPVEGFVGRIQSIAWLAGQTDAAVVQLRKVSDLFEAGMRIAIARGDRELAAMIVRDWHRVCLSITRDSHTLIGVLVAQVIASNPADVFAEAIEKLDLQDEAALLRPVLANIEAVEAHRNDPARREFGEDWEFMNRKASMLAGLGLVVPHKMLMKPPPPLTAAELRPDRRMEAAFFDRVVITPMAFIIGIAMIVFGIGWMRSGLAHRHIARRALLLVPAWKLIGTGIIAGAGPLVWYLLVTRLTSLGWPDVSFRHGMVVMVLQWLSLLCMFLMLPGLLASLALEKHASVFSWCWPGGTAWRRIAILLLILALPASGLWLLCGESAPRILGLVLAVPSGLFMALVILASFWSAWRQRKDPLRRSLRKLAAGLLASYARMLTLALCSAWLAFAVAEEKFWAGQDTLMVINPDSPAISSYESKVQELLRKQVLEMLGPEWTE